MPKYKENIKVIPMPGRYGRFIVFDELTGEVLDDAQGWGYKSIRKAWAAWTYKNRSEEEKRETYNKCLAVNSFEMSHKALCRVIDDAMFYSLKDCVPFTVKELEDIMKDEGIDFKDLPFTAKEFLKYYGKKPEKYNPEKIRPSKGKKKRYIHK